MVDINGFTIALSQNIKHRTMDLEVAGSNLVGRYSLTISTFLYDALTL